MHKELTFEQLMNKHTDFTLSTFTEANPLSSLNKLREEMDEVAHEINHGSYGESLMEEYVDCIMCLLDSAARLGIGANMIRSAFEKKIEKNLSRTWVKNEDNTYSHV